MLDPVLGSGEELGSTPHHIPLSHFPACPFEDHLQAQELHKQPVTTCAVLPKPLPWQHRGARLKEMNIPSLGFDSNKDEKLGGQIALINLSSSALCYMKKADVIM